jgi:NTE family protein
MTTGPVTNPPASAPKTAFVFAGGGSLGAIQVGMMQALVAHGVKADMVVGSSVGSMNGAYYAGNPTLEGVKQLATIWRGLRRSDVFPLSAGALLGLLWHRDFLISRGGIRALVQRNLPYQNLEDARIPVHIIATDFLSGDTVVLSRGSAADAIEASTAIPGAFAPVSLGGRYLADGAISSNTPVRVAIGLGARRLIIMPTGYTCTTQHPPMGAVANALHALTLLIARQLTAELEFVPPDIACLVVPPLCPLSGSPYDFSRTDENISRAIDTTEAWIAGGGLDRAEIPPELRPHSH